jgi:hypothetical protein
VAAMLSLVPETRFYFYTTETIENSIEETRETKVSENAIISKSTEAQANGFLIKFEVFEGTDSHFVWVPFSKTATDFELFSFSDANKSLGLVSKTEMKLPKKPFEVMPVFYLAEAFIALKKDAFFQFYKNKNFKFWCVENNIVAIPEHISPEHKDFFTSLDEKPSWKIQSLAWGQIVEYLGSVGKAASNSQEIKDVRVDSVDGAEKIHIVIPGDPRYLEISSDVFKADEATFLITKSSKHYWLYSKKVYMSRDPDLSAEDVAALASEETNKRRIRLEKAHALAAMTKQLDTRAKRQTIPQDIKTAVWQRDNGRCVECESQANLEFDHIIPLAMGGSNSFRNLQLLCEVCNRRKGASLG